MDGAEVKALDRSWKDLDSRMLSLLCFLIMCTVKTMHHLVSY